MDANPWHPDCATHKASDLATAAGVNLNVKGLRHYTASQLLAAPFDLRNTAAGLGHGSGGATMLRHYSRPGIGSRPPSGSLSRSTYRRFRRRDDKLNLRHL